MIESHPFFSTWTGDTIPFDNIDYVSEIKSIGSEGNAKFDIFLKSNKIVQARMPSQAKAGEELERLMNEWKQFIDWKYDKYALAIQLGSRPR